MQEKKHRTYDGEAMVIVCVFLINFAAMIIIDSVAYNDGVKKCKDKKQNDYLSSGGVIIIVEIITIPIYFVIVLYHFVTVERLNLSVEELEKEIEFEKIPIELD